MREKSEGPWRHYMKNGNRFALLGAKWSGIRLGEVTCTEERGHKRVHFDCTKGVGGPTALRKIDFGRRGFLENRIFGENTVSPGTVT